MKQRIKPFISVPCALSNQVICNCGIQSLLCSTIELCTYESSYVTVKVCLCSVQRNNIVRITIAVSISTCSYFDLKHAYAHNNLLPIVVRLIHCHYICSYAVSSLS